MRCALLLLAGRGAELREALESTRVFCVEHNIGYWSDVCSMWSTWFAAMTRGDPGAHLTLAAQLDHYLGSGGRVGVPHFNALLAEARLAAGEVVLAREAVETAQAHIDTAGERFYEPEVQRLTGRVLMAGADPDPDAAGAAFERAIRSAHDQGARLLELRSAIALARHQRALGEPCAALGVVASLCEWFGEESAIPDVVRGRATLAAVDPHPSSSERETT
jgi:predicted ATPase